MIRGLARKLETVSVGATVPGRPPSPPQSESVCKVIEEREPLANYRGLSDILPKTLCILGLPREADIRSALFVDTETTGLGGGSVAFLIGTGFIEGGCFVTRQLLMRDYDEEPSSLSVFADMLKDFEFLVSYNGKSFDMPLLKTRCIINKISAEGTLMRSPDSRDLRPRAGAEPPCHLDLLHASRRIWKKRLGGCSLKRIEEETLGLVRADDLPGSEVPRRYFDYLKAKDERLLSDILRHNADDVRGMARIIALLSAIYTTPALLADPLDILSLSRSLERRAVALEHRENNPRRALECADMAIGIASDEDMPRLARRKLRLEKKFE
ncbi:MAG: ribonuclease H-like domain-containing protein [Oscillospiraceae bacterium]|jgi:uncharacterized protein YprB with RNaseH-like and TPR domain|nr:ribonuclease H-like domain-containing protein [Oscillospiraceae bacterium]